jgi:threonine synthase
MHYISTRGGVAPVGFADAVMMGLGTDGGLLVPSEVPVLDAATLRDWAALPFQALALAVLTPFVGDEIPRDDLARLIERSYAGFSHPDVTPLRQAAGRTYLELFHGPTAAFKDVALQLLGNLFEYLLARDGGTLNILGATSGDKPRINIFILHPQGRVSPVQERQMTTVPDANVHNIAVRGTFDDCQHLVKALFRDLAFKERHHLGAVNSINWLRILAQTVYYFHAWGRISGGDPARKVSFAVPTGNFGDVFAGWLARRMGLPIDRLIIATNRNDILTRFVATGEYAKGDVFQTLSPAMDIQVASNFERYLYFLLGEDPAAVREKLGDLEQTGSLRVDAAQLRQVQADFGAAAVSDAETLAQIRSTYGASGYILCPHTAVGAAASADAPDTVVLATAHPAKFVDAVREAIGREAPPPPSLQGLMDKPVRCAELEASEAALRAHIEATLGP